jgi:hypothetical protein
MRPRVIAIALSALLALPILGGCTAPKVIESLWPAAASERSVPRPPGTIRWPLTGLPAPSAEAITVRVVSVKIENSPAARPQTGLDMADVVYEMISEGGITRFHALFQSQVPKVVGPVRSCRPPDLYLVPQYNSLLAHGESGIRGDADDHRAEFRARFDGGACGGHADRRAGVGLQQGDLDLRRGLAHVRPRHQRQGAQGFCDRQATDRAQRRRAVGVDHALAR